MATIPLSRIARSQSVSVPSELFLPFLAPSVRLTRLAPANPIAKFSTCTVLWKRRDNNKIRGVSAQRHTGLRSRQTLTVGIEDLPEPIKDLGTVQGSPDHGLWAFFKDKKLLQTPQDENRHGEAWSIHDLRKKSWEDLHKLWWTCVKERNRLATEKIERARIEGLYGDAENRSRDETIQETMKGIQDTLLERYNAWDDAFDLARSDPEIDLSGEGPSYNPIAEELPYDPAEIDESTEDVPVDTVEGTEQDKMEIKGRDRQAKDMPAPNFFNTAEKSPSATEKKSVKAQKLL